MKKLNTPDIETVLRPWLDQGLQGGIDNPGQWYAGMVQKTVDLILSKDPKRYRSYGPYWWIFKKVLIEQGIVDFGTFIDLEWVEKVTYGENVWDVLAAWLYSEWALDNGLIYANVHPITLIDPENPEEEPEERLYTLIDDDIEERLIQ